MRFSLIPREERFFEFFEDSAANLVAASQLLTELFDNWDTSQARLSEIKEKEHQGDAITHQIMELLHRTFVTPIDREDIALLAHTLDDVMDFMDAAVEAMIVYRVTGPTPVAKELARIIHQCTAEVQHAMSDLKKAPNLKETMRHSIEINRLENEADRVLRIGLGQLFDDSTEVTDIIKWREIYESLESATDRCE